MWKITNKHIELFNLINEFFNEDLWLNIEEIREKLNFSSSFEVMEKSKDLINKWYLDENFSVLKEIWKENIFNLPFYWFAQCWNYWKEILENYPREKFSIDKNDLPRWDISKFFVTRAKGDSMEPFIKSWDNILIQNQPSYDDENDLVLVIHNKKPKIKKIKNINNKFFLVSINKKHNDIELEEYSDDINIIWIVKQIYKNY